ncbi:MAG: respiratory nitrate reductase subunit gamma [Chloroflexi bacterium]|nr:respiratory nitrate reductase subunit gamma [Chloroflexota bacterium]
MSDFLFAVLPYLAALSAIVGSIWRYRASQFSFSSVSSQFLESRQLFWGSVPWHYGIITILIGHLVGVVFPSGVKVFNGEPVRLYILEGTALALGFLLLLGLLVLIVRRSSNARLRAVTSGMDAVLLFLLLLQVGAGLGIAIYYRWGSSWYVHTATPYFWSLFKLQPQTDYVTSLPLLVKVHIVNAFVLLALFPFTRLVHMLSVPLAYLWRSYQVVVWGQRQITSRRGQ